MNKNKKKTKKSKDKVPPAFAQQCSEPINNSMSDGESERFQEETAGMKENKGKTTTSSEMSHTDELNMKPEPPESNLQELSYMKNRCHALKSNLNATQKKYENEKKEKEKLYDENQHLKSKLSSAEKELQMLRMQIQQLEKERDHKKSLEYHEKMEVETTMDQVHEQPKQEASDDFICQEKEGSLVQNKAQGICEESWSAGEQDSEMTNSFDGEESGLPRGNDQDKNGNCHKEDRRQWGEADALDARTEAGHSIQRSAVFRASGSDTRSQNRRGSDIGQKRNERPQAQPPHRNEEQHYCPPHFRNEMPNRQRDVRNDHGQNYRRGMGNRGDHGHNYNHDVNNRDRQDHRMRTADEPSVVTEILGDLFTAPPDYSLAHCVAEDMRMGSGIAVTFKQKFKRVDELLEQRKRQGHVAVLKDEGRYIYYLVTKRESTGKPTMDTLQRSLEAMRSHVIENEVKKIAMPRIGCGLDRLEWRSVKPLIEHTFSGTGAEITVYNYNENAPESSKPKPSNVWLKNAYKPVADIAEQTAILCLCAADGSIDSTFGLLDRKFKIMMPYQKMDRKLGDILHIPKRDYLIFLLIVKETKSKPLSFMALGECIRKACKVIDKEKYYYVAVEAFDDTNDSLLFEKVITVIKTYLDTKWEKELWLCWPTTVSGKFNTRPNSET